MTKGIINSSSVTLIFCIFCILIGALGMEAMRDLTEELEIEPMNNSRFFGTMISLQNVPIYLTFGLATGLLILKEIKMKSEFAKGILNLGGILAVFIFYTTYSVNFTSSFMGLRSEIKSTEPSSGYDE